MVSFRATALQALAIALSLNTVDAAPRRVTHGTSVSSIDAREPRRVTKGVGAQSLGARDTKEVTSGPSIQIIDTRDPRRVTKGVGAQSIGARDPRRVTQGNTPGSAAAKGIQARARKNGSSKTLTAQQQAAKIPGGLSTAADGSVIMDSSIDVNGLNIRFKISGPAARFTTATNVTGAAAAPNTNSDLGLNVLLHGDGGQSFFDFPNQGVNDNLAGVALLAPNANLFWGGGSGLNRTDGVAHAQAVRDFILEKLPQMLSYDPGNVFFTGVSGGSLLLSGFFVPAHMAEFPNTGVLLNCGAMAPQVSVNNTNGFIGNTRLHFQSTQNELALLQDSIPQAVTAYSKIASTAGVPDALLNVLQTVNNEPAGGHCEFDGKDFVSGVQLMADSYSDVMQGGSGEVSGIGNVLGGTTNTTLSFGKAN